MGATLECYRERCRAVLPGIATGGAAGNCYRGDCYRDCGRELLPGIATGKCYRGLLPGVLLPGLLPG